MKMLPNGLDMGGFLDFVVDDFLEWASPCWKGKGVSGILTSPDGTEGIIVRDVKSGNETAYILQEGFDFYQKLRIKILFEQRSEMFQILGRPEKNIFEENELVKYYNKKLKDYVICNSEVRKI